MENNRQLILSVPEIAMIVGTRALLGAGLGLLLADRLLPEQRRAIGWTLVGVGALTTIPLAFEVAAKYQSFSQVQQKSSLALN
jgi:hypothetical protein